MTLSYLKPEDIDTLRGKSFAELMGTQPVDWESAMLYMAASLGLIAPHTCSWKDVVYGPTGAVAHGVLEQLVHQRLLVRSQSHDGEDMIRLPALGQIYVVHIRSDQCVSPEMQVIWEKYEGRLVHLDELSHRVETDAPGYLIALADGKRVMLDVHNFFYGGA